MRNHLGKWFTKLFPKVKVGFNMENISYMVYFNQPSKTWLGDYFLGDNISKYFASICPSNREYKS